MAAGEPQRQPGEIRVYDGPSASPSMDRMMNFLRKERETLLRFGIDVDLDPTIVPRLWIMGGDWGYSRIRGLRSAGIRSLNLQSPPPHFESLRDRMVLPFHTLYTFIEENMGGIPLTSKIESMHRRVAALIMLHILEHMFDIDTRDSHTRGRVAAGDGSADAGGDDPSAGVDAAAGENGRGALSEHNSRHRRVRTQKSRYERHAQEAGEFLSKMLGQSFIQTRYRRVRSRQNESYTQSFLDFQKRLPHMRKEVARGLKALATVDRRGGSHLNFQLVSSLVHLRNKLALLELGMEASGSGCSENFKWFEEDLLPYRCHEIVTASDNALNEVVRKDDIQALNFLARNGAPNEAVYAAVRNYFQGYGIDDRTGFFMAPYEKLLPVDEDEEENVEEEPVRRLKKGIVRRVANNGQGTAMIAGNRLGEQGHFSALMPAAGGGIKLEDVDTLAENLAQEIFPLLAYFQEEARDKKSLVQSMFQQADEADFDEDIAKKSPLYLSFNGRLEKLKKDMPEGAYNRAQNYLRIIMRSQRKIERHCVALFRLAGFVDAVTRQQTAGGERFLAAMSGTMKAVLEAIAGPSGSDGISLTERAQKEQLKSYNTLITLVGKYDTKLSVIEQDRLKESVGRLVSNSVFDNVRSLCTECAEAYSESNPHDDATFVNAVSATEGVIGETFATDLVSRDFIQATQLKKFSNAYNSLGYEGLYKCVRDELVENLSLEDECKEELLRQIADQEDGGGLKEEEVPIGYGGAGTDPRGDSPATALALSRRPDAPTVRFPEEGTAATGGGAGTAPREYGSATASGAQRARAEDEITVRRLDGTEVTGSPAAIRALMDPVPGIVQLSNDSETQRKAPKQPRKRRTKPSAATTLSRSNGSKRHGRLQASAQPPAAAGAGGPGDGRRNERPRSGAATRLSLLRETTRGSRSGSQRPAAAGAGGPRRSARTPFFEVRGTGGSPHEKAARENYDSDNSDLG